VGKIKPFLKYIRVPVCMIHATNDWTINAENMHYVLRKLGSVEKRAYMFEIDEDISTRHEILTHERIKDKVIHYIFSFLKDYDLQFKFDSEILPGRTKQKSKGWF
jgi:esterase/lipase